MNYNYNVEDYFFNTPYAGSLNNQYARVIEHQQGDYGIGDVILIQVALNKGKIEAVAFKAYGNPYLIASVAMICEFLDGAIIDSLGGLDTEFIINKLEIPQTKIHSLLLAEDAYNELMLKVRAE
jgi:NifU-like protein involved in Fe-S cluster formation